MQAISLESGSQLTLTGTVLLNNTAQQGGALFASLSSISGSGVVCDFNAATAIGGGQGGCAYLTGSQLTLTGASINDNIAANAQAGSPVTAQAGGAAIYATATSSVTLNGSAQRNQALAGDGGFARVSCSCWPSTGFDFGKRYSSNRRRWCSMRSTFSAAHLRATVALCLCRLAALSQPTAYWTRTPLQYALISSIEG